MRSHPDIVIVLTTQWRAQAMGFAGDENAKTPFLDALANRSANFVEAVTPHPFGVFARAAFMTGRLCPENGVRDYFDPLAPKTRTLAHAFSEAGYETAYFGKWQLFERSPDDPIVGEAHAKIVVPEANRGGFAFWEGFESGHLLNDPYLHGTRLKLPTCFRGYQSDVLADRFLDFLSRRESDSPLFSIVSMDAPHPPYGAAAGGVAALDPSRIRIADNVPDDPSIREKVGRELSGYYAHIAATDRAIGRIAEGIDDVSNTLFVVTSVHGDMHGAHGLFRKGWPHEESVRVPLLLSWPRMWPSGFESDGLVALSDLGSTLLGLIGETGDPFYDARRDFASSLSEGVACGNEFQAISMPSVVPFALQCPFAWSGRRYRDRTEIEDASGRCVDVAR